MDLGFDWSKLSSASVPRQRMRVNLKGVLGLGVGGAGAGVIAAVSVDLAAQCGEEVVGRKVREQDDGDEHGEEFRQTQQA